MSEVYVAVAVVNAIQKTLSLWYSSRYRSQQKLKISARDSLLCTENVKNKKTKYSIRILKRINFTLKIREPDLNKNEFNLSKNDDGHSDLN